MEYCEIEKILENNETVYNNYAHLKLSIQVWHFSIVALSQAGI